MALSEENGGMVMPVSPYYGGNGNGDGMFGNSGWWLILLLLIFGNGMWGGFGMNGMGGMMGGFGGLYPWMNQSQQINDGFRDQMLNTSVNNIQNGIISGFGDVQNSLCAGFNGVNAAITNAQMAALERSFAAQTANTSGMTALQGQLAQCCCDNRLATERLNATIVSENCADREALNYATRDILNNQNAGIQRILDQMCQDKIDAKNDEIANLRTQLNMANLAASQGAQTSRILADNAAQTTMLEQYLAPVPRPAYIVQNPNGCGCNQNPCCQG